MTAVSVVYCNVEINSDGLKCDEKSTKCSLSSIQGNFQRIEKTLVGLTWENPVLDPLAVPHLNNQQYISAEFLGGM